MRKPANHALQRLEHFGESAKEFCSVNGVEGYFGEAVAISGDIFAVGGGEEDSAYAFRGAGSGPRLRSARPSVAGCSIAFPAVADVSYELWRSLSLSGPWEKRAAAVASTNGMLELIESDTSPAQSFYRVRIP